MSTWGYAGIVAWLLVLTALVGWAVYSVERSHHRIDTLGERQDRVDDLARQVQDWWDDGEEMGTEPGHGAAERPAEPLGHADTPTSPEDGTGALKGSEPVDRVRVPLPPPAATVAIPAVSADQINNDPDHIAIQAERDRLREAAIRRDAETFEPDPHPDTVPALERRGIGRWVEGPGGSLVYRPTTPPEEGRP